MESLQHITQRLKGVKNINQITRAMELVAATKMRRSQEIALASRPYAFAALDMLATLSRLEGVPLPPLLRPRDVRRTAIVLITSDKGLAGSFNSAVIRTCEKFLKSQGVEPGDRAYAYIAVGAKAAAFFEKRAGRCDAAFLRFGDFTTLDEVAPLSQRLVEGYTAGEWDRVIVFSTNFKSALRQEVVRREVFPIDFEALKKTAAAIVPETGKFAELIRGEKVSFFGSGIRRGEYLIEPSPEEVLGQLVPHLVEMQIYHIILEANASEHAARRMAMKSASDNASELAGKLTIAYNKSRQAVITSQIIEITAGAESLK